MSGSEGHESANSEHDMIDGEFDDIELVLLFKITNFIY